MTLFDSYVPGTWIDQGLTVPVPSHDERQPETRHWKQNPFNFFRAVTQASVLAVGMALTSLSFSASEVVVGTEAYVVDTIEHEMAEADVPSGYWADLIAMVRKAPVMPSDDTTGDPPPLW
jgi:hypothetical protein